MTPDEILEFNRLCAKLLWPLETLELCGDGSFHIVECDEHGTNCIQEHFNPYHDANHKNKVLEKAMINTCYNPHKEIWECDDIESGRNPVSYGLSPRMEAAQNACIWEYLNDPK